MINRRLENKTRNLEQVLENLSPEMQADWVIHPCTKALRHWVDLLLETQLETWKNGGFTGESQDETIQKNSAAIGMCDALQEIEDCMAVVGGKQQDD